MASPGSTESPRNEVHYPLDIPGTPFSRYVHSFTERDVHAYRIMSAHMNRHHGSMQPPLPRGSSSSSGTSTIRQPRVRFQEPDEVLRRREEERRRRKEVIRRREQAYYNRFLEQFLFSSPDPETEMYRCQDDTYIFLDDTVFPVNYRSSLSLCPPPASEGGIVLHMVMRHYLETDDSALRTWLAGLRGGINGSRLDGGCVVTPIWPECHLFDGGAIFPRLRRRLADKNIVTESLRCLDTTAAWPEPDGFSRYMLLPAHGNAKALLKKALLKSHVSESEKTSAKLPRWIRGLSKRRPVSLAEKEPSKLLPIKDFALDKCVKDFALDPGRGWNRDGHWSTGREDGWTVLPTGRREELKAAGVRFEEHLADLRYRSPAYSDGRHGRRRRRCTSLPPPGSFVCVAMTGVTGHDEPNAEIPGKGKAPEFDPAVVSLKPREDYQAYPRKQALAFGRGFRIEAGPEAPAEMSGNEEAPGPWLLIFPRMKLSQLDRRSRRRSLSRTRIEEMFD
ncbi:hypothetical protein V8F06_005582 [Rhypophila decipiens]